jgi:hypothetical protein
MTRPNIMKGLACETDLHIVWIWCAARLQRLQGEGAGRCAVGRLEVARGCETLPVTRMRCHLHERGQQPRPLQPALVVP